MRKKNSYLDFLTNFTQDHAIPTKNVNLIQIHEKNQGLLTRLEQLQASQKGIMMKNFQINTRHEAEKRKLRTEMHKIEDLLEEKNIEVERLKAEIEAMKKPLKSVESRKEKSDNGLPDDNEELQLEQYSYSYQETCMIKISADDKEVQT